MLHTISPGLDGEVLVIRKIVKSRVLPPARGRVAEVLGVSLGQSRIWEVSWAQNRKLVRWHVMPHYLQIQWKTMGALR